ncbi:MAG: YitT family protein [Thermotogae bacterium]|nr:MAG: YitT family protein [Thermotogota bacterium]
MNNNGHKTLVYDYAIVTLGSLITALSLDMFLIPNKVIAGGVSGLATIVYYLTGFPVGVQMLIYNTVLFILAFLLLGVKFGIKSIYSAVVLSLLVDFFNYVVKVPIPDLSSDKLLAPIYGGLIAGIGMGMVFWRGASTGGTDIVAMILNRFFGISSGMGLLYTDSLITLFAVLALGPIPALYGILAIVVTGKVIDAFLEGVEHSRTLLIVSEKVEEIKKRILEDLGRGATMIPAKGAYTDQDRTIVMTAVKRRDLTQLRKHVREVDPKAFVIVLTNAEVYGEGFKELRR